MKCLEFTSALTLVVFGAMASVAAEGTRLTVSVDRPGATISPTMYGIFFEDINFGADGGLYPELVKNRSFEFPDPLMGWTKVQRSGAQGTLAAADQEPFHAANPHYLRLQVADAGEGFGVANEGFREMGVRQGATYTFSAQVRQVAGEPLSLRVELITSDGRTVGQAKLNGFTNKWQAYTAKLCPTATTPKARLYLLAEGRGTLDLDMISLFPEQTFKNRPNGLRPDVAQMLADLKPGFMRFPGGCIVEGHTLSNRYQWKTTIGPLEERRLIMNRWNDEFKHRPAPDYYQSFGLGFFEFFQLCADIGAEPLPILNCGMACQFNSGELVPLDQLEPYIQDALDLIEFANGPATSTWGAKRVALGRVEPFGMKLLGVGNEQWGPQYIERYERFAKVLKAKYPEIRLVSSSGPGPADDKFHFAWPRLRALNADIVDEHCYHNPGWFYAAATRYDNYPRTGPKVFMGEYAAQSDKVVSPENRNNWECALAEAAFLTGLERNADVVVMSSYAPLGAHVDGWQWRPNLIWFDNLRVVGTANYYAHKLFSTHLGSVVLPVQLAGLPAGSSLYVVASRLTSTGEVILKVVNAAAQAVPTQIQLQGAGRVEPAGRSFVMAAALQDENTLDNPTKVAPREAVLAGAAARFQHTFPAHSVSVLRLKVSN